MNTKRIILGAAIIALSHMDVSGKDYTDYLTTDRGFHEVTCVDSIVTSTNDYYILVAAETHDLIVGVGRYEGKPEWAGENTKALRYASAAIDPVFQLSNFFTIEKSGNYIGLRNVAYSSDLFQTHDNAGYMYVNTFTDPTLDEWSYLTPTFQNGYWLFESGKYPISSNNWASGYLGPWNNRVEVGEALALNRKNTENDAAGHYRLFHITKAQLSTLRLQPFVSATESTPVDATWLIVNPSFETGDETGWTLVGKDPNGNDEFKTHEYGMTNKDGDFLMNAFQWWAPLLSVTQTVESVPSGIYELSAVVCTWEGRTVTFSGNETTIVTNGINDATGIPVSMPLTIGNDETLSISAASTGQWWEAGHEGEIQTFFKLDDVRLTCKGIFLNGVSLPLPNDETTPLTPGQWYYYDVAYPSEYMLVGNLDGMAYSTDGNVLLTNITTSTPERTMTLSLGRVYFKTTRNDATLAIKPLREMVEGTFTAVALNVDGLPQKILTYTLNEDGPGEEGTKLISQYLYAKGYDLIGTSEDFNYHNSLMTALNGYSSGEVRATLSVSGIFSGFPFDTDGLNLIWKDSKMAAENETWTRWNSSKSGEGNQYVKKGFRHYDVTIDGNYTMDVYVLHMDAGGEEYAASREGQWKQLANAINGTDLSRPKLILGDTNSRWTREEIAANFTNVLSTSLTMGDTWVELCRGNIYPTTAMSDITDQSDPTNYANYEVVDKIIYINPTAANTLQITPQSFKIEQDYTYGTVENTNDNTPLGDHRPVVVTFSYTQSGDALPLNLELSDTDDNSKTIGDHCGLTANVTLKNRTLYKDNKWNTLCLPFNIDDLNGTPLEGASVKTLSSSSYNSDTNTLTLDFGDNTTSIVAGKPYIVKWTTTENTETTNPTFDNVTIGSATPTDVETEAATFKGLYAPLPIESTDQTMLYLGQDNKLYYPNAQMTINAFRAYFVLGEGVTIGKQNPGINHFVVNFGEGESTGVEEIPNLSIPAPPPTGWFTIDGRILPSQPTSKGIYLHNGQKVVITKATSQLELGNGSCK